MEKYDLIILGSGAAAFGAAIKAVDMGANVAMIEKGTIGGTCVNVGCVPSKYLLLVGEINYCRNHGHTGLDVRTALDFAGTINEKREIVEGLRNGRYIKVTVLQRSPRIIPEEESIISDYLKTYLEDEGINVWRQ